MTIQETVNLLNTRGLAVLDVKASMIHGNQPAIRETYTIVLLCTAGEAWAEYNMERIHIVPRSRVCFAQLILSDYNRVSPDFEARVVVMKNSLSLEAAVDINTDMLLAVTHQSVEQITDDDDWEMLLALVNVIKCYCELDAMTTDAELSLSLVRSLLLALSGVTLRASDSLRSTVFTHGDKYFRRFVSDVLANVRTQHEVSFYAARLCITPKYLSSVCKLKGNRTAKDIISAILVAKLKREIITSGKSLKEIALEYGFADQSSLGKFFRKEVGVSPALFKHGATSEQSEQTEHR